MRSLRPQQDKSSELAFPSRWARVRNNALGPLLMLPAALFVAAVICYPAIYGFMTSLQKQVGFAPPRFVGLANYASLLANSRFWEAATRTVWWTVSTVLAQIVLGVLIALVLHQTFRWRGIARTIALFPWAVPTVVAGIIWRWMFADLYGIVNHLGMKLGLIDQSVPWLGQVETAFAAVTFVGIWKYYPFVTINVLARLQMIPEQLYEAAMIDGCNSWQRFRYVTLPELKSILFVVTLLRVLYMFPKFDLIWILTNGGPSRSTETLAIFAYLRAFLSFDLSTGATVAVLICLVLGIFTGVYAFVNRHSKE